MPAKNYLSILYTRPFLYTESKRIAELMQSGMTSDDMLQTVLDENLFQLKSKDRAGRFYREIIKRLDNLDIFLFNQFLTSDTQTSKAILFYALLKRDQLFYEWMREVVWDKFLILDWQMDKKDTRKFFEHKSEQSDTVKNWSQTTKESLLGAYHRVLVDVEMAVDQGETLELQKLILNPDVREYLIEKKEQLIVEVVLGELIG